MWLAIGIHCVVRWVSGPARGSSLGSSTAMHGHGMVVIAIFFLLCVLLKVAEYEAARDEACLKLRDVRKKSSVVHRWRQTDESQEGRLCHVEYQIWRHFGSS